MPSTFAALAVSDVVNMCWDITIKNNPDVYWILFSARGKLITRSQLGNKILFTRLLACPVGTSTLKHMPRVLQEPIHEQQVTSEF